jgi:hypothetical protein
MAFAAAACIATGLPDALALAIATCWLCSAAIVALLAAVALSSDDALATCSEAILLAMADSAPATMAASAGSASTNLLTAYATPTSNVMATATPSMLSAVDCRQKYVDVPESCVEPLIDVEPDNSSVAWTVAGKAYLLTLVPSGLMACSMIGPCTSVLPGAIVGWFGAGVDGEPSTVI